MSKKIRGLYLFLLSLMLLVLMSTFAYARGKESKIYVTDDAGLLSSSEVASLREDLSVLSNKWGCDIVVVTTNSTYEKTITQYADDFYDYNIFEKDGVLLLIDMESRGWWISTTGSCIDAFTDAGIQWIGKDITKSLSKGDYYKAFKSYMKDCDKFLKQADKGKPYDVGHMPVTTQELVGTGVICSIIGLIISGITLLIFSAGNKSVKSVDNAASYVVDGSMILSHESDEFVNKVVSKDLIPRDDDSRSGGSGGGSTIHVGSSGTSHGGGGGHF